LLRGSFLLPDQNKQNSAHSETADQGRDPPWEITVVGLRCFHRLCGLFRFSAQCFCQYVFAHGAGLGCGGGRGITGGVGRGGFCEAAYNACAPVVGAVTRPFFAENMGGIPGFSALIASCVTAMIVHMVVFHYRDAFRSFVIAVKAVIKSDSLLGTGGFLGCFRGDIVLPGFLVTAGAAGELMYLFIQLFSFAEKVRELRGFFLAGKHSAAGAAYNPLG
jgi:hypothetical protein